MTANRRARAVALAVLVLAGCGQAPQQPGPGASVEKLDVLKPASGGEMAQIPGGEFMMGDAHGRPDETQHAVSVSAFYMDRYLVTQEVYEKTMGKNPSKRKGAQNPVEQIRWTEAAAFCNKCSEIEGLTPCYDPKTWDCSFAANGYRLPTEAEWEYACRAGSTTKYCFGDNESLLPQYAWLKPHSRGTPQPVGEKLPNRWGLYDMHGNVWEWCDDFYAEGYYKKSPKENPTGPATGEQRVLRGGAWNSTADACRSAYRSKEVPVFADACFGADAYGFRRVRSGVAKSRTEGKSDVSVAVPEPKAETKTVAPVVAPAGATIDVSRLKGTIVFVSDRGRALAIWQMHASGKDAKQLTKPPENDADPRFSPDGRQIAYTSLRGGFPEVWLMNRDGSGGKRVTEGCQPDWSPDGKAFVFVRDNRVWTRNLTTGEEKRITPEAWERCGVPAWRPDGKQIALASRHLAAIGVFLVSVDGKEIAQLKTEEPSCTPRWSADGKRLLCQTTKGHVHQVGVDGKGWEQMTFGADFQHDARYSPDGSMVVFCRAPASEGPWQICVKKLDGDDMEFVPLTSEGSNLAPDWHAGE